MIIHFTDITSFEEDLSDRIRDSVKTWFKPIMLLRNDEQKVVADGYPYLRVDSITGCAVEGLDVEMLLDPLEKVLNLPPVTVEFSNRDSLKCEVIGQEPIYRSFPKVLVHNESERVRILFGRVISYKSDGLVREDRSTSLDSWTSYLILSFARVTKKAWLRWKCL